MSTTLFKEVGYSLAVLINNIQMGSIGLPDIQRPFVWKNSKVRDLFDSMYRGYPVGYFLFWENQVGVKTKQIGVNKSRTFEFFQTNGRWMSGSPILPI